MQKPFAITLDVATLESAAAFLLEDPNRLIIDLRGITPRITGVPGARPSLDPRLPGGVPGGVDVSKLAPDAASAPDIVAPPAPIGPMSHCPAPSASAIGPPDGKLMTSMSNPNFLSSCSSWITWRGTPRK